MGLKILKRALDVGADEDAENVGEAFSDELAVNPAYVIAVLGSEDRGGESIVFLAHRPKGYRVRGTVEEVIDELND